KSEAQIDELAVLQSRLLAQAGTLVKSGGTLVYCTCSLEPEEGEAQIESFLRVHTDYRRLAVTAQEIGAQSQFITKEGDLRALPPMNIGTDQGLDGFYAARLVRR